MDDGSYFVGLFHRDSMCGPGVLFFPYSFLYSDFNKGVMQGPTILKNREVFAPDHKHRWSGVVCFATPNRSRVPSCITRTLRPGITRRRASTALGLKYHPSSTLNWLCYCVRSWVSTLDSYGRVSPHLPMITLAYCGLRLWSMEFTNGPPIEKAKITFSLWIHSYTEMIWCTWGMWLWRRDRMRDQRSSVLMG